MTLRCPKCGGKRVIFLSTTDGTSVGSTDQRYLCKDCGYRGTFILDDDVGPNDLDLMADLRKIEKELDDEDNRGKNARG